MKPLLITCLLLGIGAIQAHYIDTEQSELSPAIAKLESLVKSLDLDEDSEFRIKRGAEYEDDRGVTNLDIREAILQLLQVIKRNGDRMDKNAKANRELGQEILGKVATQTGSKRGSAASTSTERKIDNISTFLLRMNAKLESIERRVKRGGRGGSGDILETLAQESFDILTVLPTYIENTKDAITSLSRDTKNNFKSMNKMLVDESSGANGEQKSLVTILKDTESSLLGASTDLKDIVIESGHMAETLFERVNDGYKELTEEIKGLSNVEQVLLDTADSVMDTKRKVEFGVQQIIFKVGELVKMSGGEIDVQLKDQFADITRTILSNQTEALANLTQKVEKEIGQVWRQMGIMYGQVSNSIKILEKVKESTEGYVNKTGKNLGTMEGQVEGLTDRMVDVDSNLNYMLGQLSLVVQEFNQVKTGLGEAMSGLGEELDEIKEYKPANDGK